MTSGELDAAGNYKATLLGWGQALPDSGNTQHAADGLITEVRLRTDKAIPNGVPRFVFATLIGITQTSSAVTTGFMLYSGILGGTALDIVKVTDVEDESLKEKCLSKGVIMKATAASTCDRLSSTSKDCYVFNLLKAGDDPAVPEVNQSYFAMCVGEVEPSGKPRLPLYCIQTTAGLPGIAIANYDASGSPLTLPAKVPFDHYDNYGVMSGTDAAGVYTIAEDGIYTIDASLTIYATKSYSDNGIPDLAWDSLDYTFDDGAVTTALFNLQVALGDMIITIRDAITKAGNPVAKLRKNGGTLELSYAMIALQGTGSDYSTSINGHTLHVLWSGFLAKDDEIDLYGAGDGFVTLQALKANISITHIIADGG